MKIEVSKDKILVQKIKEKLKRQEVIAHAG